MDKPKISVIVPIYKVEKYLVQCLDSIVNQTLRDIELILVDEGDMDACRYIIDHYEQTDSRVKAIHEKNGGYGASVNKGFDIAEGEYISIIESDDFIEPDMYEKMYTYAKKLDADVVKTPYYEYWDKIGKDPEIIRTCFWYDWVKDIPENKLFSIEEYPVFMGIHPSVWSCIYKKSYFDKFNIRFLDNKGAFVDHHFKIVALLNTNKIAWLNTPFYKYRLSNPNASASAFDISIAIRRWNEFHKLIQEKFKDKYEKFVQYNLREEYVNTFEKVHISGYSITPDDCNMLIENLSYTTKEQIKAARGIPLNGRRFMLAVKNNKNVLKRYVRTNKSNAEYSEIKFLGIPLFKTEETKLNTYKIKLFNFIPLLKLKKRCEVLSKIYLFGLLPVISKKEVI